MLPTKNSAETAISTSISHYKVPVTPTNTEIAAQKVLEGLSAS
jgi:hypothetical protein